MIIYLYKLLCFKMLNSQLSAKLNCKILRNATCSSWHIINHLYKLYFNIVNISCLCHGLESTHMFMVFIWWFSGWRYLHFSPAVFQFRIPINLCKAWRQSQDAVSTMGMKRIMLLGWCSLLWGTPPSLVTEKFAPVIYQVLSGHRGAGESQGRLLLGGPACNMCILGLWWAGKNCWCAHCC